MHLYRYQQIETYLGKKMKKKNIKDIAEILPEGLDEEVIKDIAKVFNDIIEEEVSKEVEVLKNNVMAFLNMKREEIKESALKELEDENDIYRDAQIFRSLKALMNLELNGEDDDRAVSKSVREHNEISQENEALASELFESLSDNSKLQNTVNALGQKLEQLNEDRVELQEEVLELNETIEHPFESDERAVIIADNVDAAPIKDTTAPMENEFLTEEILRLAKSRI